MQSYKVAHLNIQNQHIIFVPLDRQFGYRTNEEQTAFVASLQRCADSAGLQGRIVPAWEASGGRTIFIGPHQWHSYFNGINLAWVWTNINRELTCG